jgi:hypothetical protein
MNWKPKFTHQRLHRQDMTQENEGLIKIMKSIQLTQGTFDVPTDGSTTTFFKWVNKRQWFADGTNTLNYRQKFQRIDNHGHKREELRAYHHPGAQRDS